MVVSPTLGFGMLFIVKITNNGWSDENKLYVVTTLPLYETDIESHISGQYPLSVLPIYGLFVFKPYAEYYVGKISFMYEPVGAIIENWNSWIV